MWLIDCARELARRVLVHALVIADEVGVGDGARDPSELEMRWQQFTGPVMDRAPKLRVIGRPGIGVDNVDLVAASERGICVVNTPDAPTEPVAEKVVGWMIMLAHHLHDADRVTRSPGWQGRSALLGSDLQGKCPDLTPESPATLKAWRTAASPASA